MTNEIHIPTYISKSMVFSFDFCPVQFYKNYILKIRQKETQAMLVGTRFHTFAETFYKFCDKVPDTAWNSFIHEDFQAEEIEMIENFLEFERNRQYDGDWQFQPWASEWWGQSEDLKIRGYVDRIDVSRHNPKEVRLIEFKTGAKWRATQHKQELVFYSIMFHNINPDYKVTKMGCYNPRLDQYDEWDLKEADIKRVKVKWGKVLDAIETMEFKPKCSQIKFAVCGMCEPEECAFLWRDKDERSND